MYTMKETPLATIIVERRPSDIFDVTIWLTSKQSDESRLISSPVLWRSKYAVSCDRRDLNNNSLSLFVIL